MTRQIPAFAVALLAWGIGCASVAEAQTTSGGRYEVSVGIQRLGVVSVARVEAAETTPGGGTRPLVGSETFIAGAAGATAALGVRVSRAMRVEATMAYTPTRLRTRLSGDAEAVAAATVDVPMALYVAQGGLVAHLSRWRVGALQPFVTAGVGYMRQVLDSGTLIETGRAYYAGGGLYYERASSHPRHIKVSGLRLDVRAHQVRGGIATATVGRGTSSVTASVFARF